MVADQKRLLQWYAQNQRELPWRANRDPYRIWISEVMLQQTTVQAVIPYFERFLLRFPDLGALASSPVEDVVALWAGLGYYSRARNLHRAAIEIFAVGGFPRTHEELAHYPGFGPYTSRAVSSLAFGENVGVVDGNVIRVLSRKYGIIADWWTPAGRAIVQEHADRLCTTGDSSKVNQAFMDLGATICVPKNPKCLICPWTANCVARSEARTDELPRARPRKAREVWIWRPSVVVNRGRAGLVENQYAPFLKGHLIWPGTAERKNKAPKKFHFRHSITCHDIFVILNGKTKAAKDTKWVPLKNLKRVAPSSLLQKALEARGEKA
ncbi:MAG: A/G-specific adenine glycosylase [Bdellovibrionia bacterium]